MQKENCITKHKQQRAKVTSEVVIKRKGKTKRYLSNRKNKLAKSDVQVKLMS